MQPSTARSSGSSGQQLDETNGMRSCDHDLDHGDPGQEGGGWVRALAVATFDVGTGHTLEQVTMELKMNRYVYTTTIDTYYSYY